MKADHSINHILNELASTWDRQLRSTAPSPAPSTLWPRLQVLLQCNSSQIPVGSVHSRWMTSCGLWHPGAQSSSIPSPEPVTSEFPQANPLWFQKFGDIFATSFPLYLCHRVFFWFFLDTAPISQGMLGCCIGVWTRCSGVSASSCGCPGATIAGGVAWRPFSSFPVLRAWFLWNKPTRAVKHFHNKKHSE